MLVDKTNGNLAEIKEFAKSVNKVDQLQEQLDYLAGYAVQETRCVLYPDFAPHSLAFVMEQRGDDNEWKLWFNGGLIFHGSHDGFGSGNAPTFSVCLSPTDGWQVHT